MSTYQQLIREIVPDANSRHVEAWMRSEHGTLDALDRKRFDREARLAAAYAESAGPEMSERLAETFGLSVNSQ